MDISLVREIAKTDKWLASAGAAHWLSKPKNEKVWRAFEREANYVWFTGRPRYSARTIGETIRNRSPESDDDITFKVNDHAWPMLARIWTALHPDREGFFELRGPKS